MKNSYLLIAGLLLLTHQQMRAERIDTLLHFSYVDLKVDTLTASDGNTYTFFDYPKMYMVNTPGFPIIPLNFFSVYLPSDAENISLNLRVSSSSLHTLDHKVYPMQIAKVLDEKEKKFTPCDSNTYFSNNPIPNNFAIITDILPSGLYEKKIDIAAYPIRYYPLENYYEFCEDLEITISYIHTSGDKSQRVEHSINNTRTSNLPHYEYCIITNRSLKDSFKRLVAWKKQKGLNAGIICVEDIIADPGIIKDITSNIADSAGQIRQYIKESYENANTKYVLLGGDGHVVPIRYGTWHEWNNIDEAQIPSDYYYSELYSNWNLDQDEYYGELGDDQLYNSTQVYVGRILCSTSEEVENYTNKVLRYEMNPGNKDYSYLRKALFQEFGHAKEDGLAYDAKADLLEQFPNSTIVSGGDDEYTVPNGNDLIAELNNHYGYVDFLGSAGTSYGVTVKQIGNHIFYAITSVQGNIPGAVQETANGLDSLKNKDYPMIAYSSANFNATFDVYEEDHSNLPNMANSFTLGKDYGGPIFIGNTRHGLYIPNSIQLNYGYHGLSYALAKKFNEGIRDSSNTISQSHRASLENYPSSSIDPCKHYLVLSSNLIGCPELHMWTNTPALFSAVYDVTGEITANNFINQEVEAVIHDVSLPNEPLDNSMTFNPSEGPISVVDADCYLITLHGLNCIPQILPLYIHNPEMSGTHYLFTKDVLCQGRSGETVHFTNGSDYTFETSGTFKIGKNSIIEKGAKFKVLQSNIKY